MNYKEIAGLLIILGAIIIISGIIIYGLGSLTGWKKIPGDILYKSDRTIILIPVVTMIIISVVLTILLNVIFFFLRK